jgi:transcription elongation factor Elf1
VWRRENHVNTPTTYQQADARRRLRRRAQRGFDRRFFCGTNGCASRLELDATTGIATCPICGFTRRISAQTH